MATIKCKKTSEKKRVRSLVKENMRLGASSDYAKGYQQALKDMRARR